MTLVAIDPGLRGCGVAVFFEGLLCHAAYAKNPERVARGPEAWISMAEAVRAEVRNAEIQLVLEVPQVYAAGRSKGDPDDLLELAGVDGAIAAVLQPKTIAAFKPRTWKGQVPKEIHQARMIKRLRPEELMVLEVTKVPPSLRHNVLDAVALGIWFLGR